MTFKIPSGCTTPPSTDRFTVSFSSEVAVIPKRNPYDKRPTTRVRALNGFLENQEGMVLQFSGYDDAMKARDEFLDSALPGTVAFINLSVTRRMENTLAENVSTARTMQLVEDDHRAAFEADDCEEAGSVDHEVAEGIAEEPESVQTLGDILSNALERAGVAKPRDPIKDLTSDPFFRWLFGQEPEDECDGLNRMDVAKALKAVCDSGPNGIPAAYDIAEGVDINKIDPEDFRDIYERCKQLTSPSPDVRVNPLTGEEGKLMSAGLHKVSRRPGESVRHAVARHCNVHWSQVSQNDDGSYAVFHRS